MEIRADQIKQLHTLLSLTGNMPNKANLVFGFSGGRGESSKVLTSAEATDFINFLQGNKPEDADNKMRRKIISLAYEMKWAKPGKWKEAIIAINGFVAGQHGIFKKELNLHTHNELVQVVSQFELLYKKYLKGI